MKLTPGSVDSRVWIMKQISAQASQFSVLREQHQDYQATRARYALWASQRLRGLLVTAGRPQSSHTAATAKITGEVSSFCMTCSVRTSRAVKIETKGAGAAAFSTLGRPFASSRSTRQMTPTTSNPNSRAASIACTVEAPLVQ